MFRSCLRCGASGEAGPNNQHEMGGEGGRGKQGRCGGGMVLVEARSPLRTMGLGGVVALQRGEGGSVCYLICGLLLGVFFYRIILT